MTADILGRRPLEAFVRSWNLIPDKGGKFEVTVNGDLIFSKKQLGRHAEPGEVLALFRQKLFELYPDAERIIAEAEADDP
ncbi:MAG: Rdx family protein [Anaerolineae bacterium]|nr:Rdx family protein [Anaerolineae bacterium]